MFNKTFTWHYKKKFYQKLNSPRNKIHSIRSYLQTWRRRVQRRPNKLAKLVPSWGDIRTTDSWHGVRLVIITLVGLNNAVRMNWIFLGAKSVWIMMGLGGACEERDHVILNKGVDLVLEGTGEVGRILWWRREEFFCSYVIKWKRRFLRYLQINGSSILEIRRQWKRSVEQYLSI